jgi:hypothetical protein
LAVPTATVTYGRRTTPAIRGEVTAQSVRAASGKAVTQFSVARNEYIGQGKEKAEHPTIIT